MYYFNNYLRMKINNLTQLKAEKARIKKNARHLEETISSDWKELRQCLAPGNAEQKNTKNSPLKNAIAFGIKLATKKAVDKTAEKIFGFFQKK